MPPVTCLPCSVPVGEGDVCGYHTCPQTNGRSRRKEVITQTGLLPCPTYPPNRRLFAFRPEHVQEKERQLELELDHILKFRHATRRGTTCCILLYVVNVVRAAPCPACLHHRRNLPHPSWERGGYTLLWRREAARDGPFIPWKRGGVRRGR